MKPLKSSVAEKLSKCRGDAGLSQSDVARAIGAPEPMMVSKWERGVSIPSAKYLDGLAKLYNKPASYFLDQGVSQIEPTVIKPNAESLYEYVKSLERDVDDLRSILEGITKQAARDEKESRLLEVFRERKKEPLLQALALYFLTLEQKDLRQFLSQIRELVLKNERGRAELIAQSLAPVSKAVESLLKA